MLDKPFRRRQGFFRMACGFACFASLICLKPLIWAQDLNHDHTIERMDPPVFGFYAKYLNCGGIAIRGSRDLRDDTMRTVCERVSQIFMKSYILQRNMTQRGVEIHLVGNAEKIAMLPEFRGAMTSLNSSLSQPNEYGLCFETANESAMLDQCTAQIALEVMLYGFDPIIRKEIQEQFQTARLQHLWDGIDAGQDAKQYWSQLSIWYFGGRGDCTQKSKQCPASGKESLNSYDPGGYSLLSRLYEGVEKPKAIEVIRARSVSRLALSSISSVPAELQLVNNGGHPIRVSRMDPYGHIMSVSELGPFNRMVLSTSLFQIWLLNDQKGVELDRFIVENTVSEYIVSN